MIFRNSLFSFDYIAEHVGPSRVRTHRQSVNSRRADGGNSFEAGLKYWDSVPASVNGVLGGFGPATTVPKQDAISSRLLLLSLFPQLSLIVPPHLAQSTTANPNAESATPSTRRSYRALDAGAGIGRISSTVLLPLFDRVELVEPCEQFIRKAVEDATAAKRDGWKLLATDNSTPEPDKERRNPKGVRFWQAGLQFFDPATPGLSTTGTPTTLLATVPSPSSAASSSSPAIDWPNTSVACDVEDGYDVCFLQWCLGHLSNEQLKEFLIRCQKSLRRSGDAVEGYIIVKENICRDTDGPKKIGEIFDHEDSSVTR